MFNNCTSMINYVFYNCTGKDFAHKLPYQIENVHNLQILKLYFMLILNEESYPMHNCTLY